MSSENDFSKLKKEIKFGLLYSERDFQKDVKEFSKLSVFLSDEHSKDLAEFMILMINSDSPERKKKKMFKDKYKILTSLTLSDLGKKGYVSFVKEKMAKFKQKKDKK